MTLSSDVIMRCDDFIFQIDTNNNQMRYSHKGHVVEVAAGAQPSAVQRGRSSMPPADSTEGMARPSFRFVLNQRFVAALEEASQLSYVRTSNSSGECSSAATLILGTSSRPNDANCVCSRDQTHDISNHFHSRMICWTFTLCFGDNALPDF